MKALLILAAAAAISPAFVACSNSNQQESAVKQDEQVLEQLGDKGDAAIVEPGSEGVTTNGDTVVAMIDDVNIQ